MKLEDRIRAALTLDALRPRLPPTPRVVEIRHELSTDSTGDPAVFVWIILDDATSRSGWSRDHLEPIEDAVRAALADREIELWPYIRFRSFSEQRQLEALPVLT
jgi:hypothetical protein